MNAKKKKVKHVPLEDLRERDVVRANTRGESLSDRGHVINIRGRNGGVIECRVRWDDGSAETVEPDAIKVNNKT